MPVVDDPRYRGHATATPAPTYGTPWEQQFLKDIDAPDSSQNATFLSAWLQAEGPNSLAYNNPFNTTQQETGSYSVNSAGVQGYGSMNAGLLANAAALEQNHPGYNQLLGFLRQGNVDPAIMGQVLQGSAWGTHDIGAVLQGWGDKLPPGYDQLMGQFAGNLQKNGPQIASGAVQDTNIRNQQMLNQLLAQINSQYATQEAGFQQQNVALSEQQLGIQRGQLARLQTEYPALFKLQQQQNTLTDQGYAQQIGDVNRNFAYNVAGSTSGAAGAGTLFTGGHRADINQLRADRGSQLHTIGRERQSLKLSEQSEFIQFQEQMSGLKDQSKNLDILAQRYGISKQEIQARLQNTLNQMNVSSQMTASDLAQQLAQTDIGMNALINNAAAPPVAQGVYGIGGGSPQMYQPPYPQVP